MQSHRAYLLALFLAAATVVPIQAQETIRLSAEQKETVSRLVETTLDTRDNGAKNRSVRPRYLVDVWAYVLPSPHGSVQKLAEVTHFDYDGGVTLRTLVDLSQPDQPRVQKVETFTAYPTPLAEPERQRALQLAEGVAQVQTLREQHGDKLKVRLLVPVVADADHPRFGHRLVQAYFTVPDQPQQTVAVDLDLTDHKVLAPDPQ